MEAYHFGILTWIREGKLNKVMDEEILLRQQRRENIILILLIGLDVHLACVVRIAR